MKKNVLAGILFMLAFGGALAFLMLQPAEPVYQGRTISAWQDDWASLKPRGWPEAVQHIGTNAIPYAVRNLARNDSVTRSSYSKLQSKLPAFLNRFFPAPKPLMKAAYLANVFYYVGSNSMPQAISSATALLKHHSPTVRQGAALAIGSLRKRSAAANPALPALMDALADTDGMVRAFAEESIGEMGADASNSVPDLTRLLADRGRGSQIISLFVVRASAAHALGRIGPSAAGSLPSLRAAMQDGDSFLRGNAAVAVWRINGDVDSTLPVLLTEMATNIEYFKWDWISAIGEMGPRAKTAIPQLQNELKLDHKWILEHVTNCLKSIGP